ncbi:sensor histidine kinase [Streptomyces sp. NPDC004111]|uniref:sensor histidine kinase n=1 Tax=Streptomyces sp. NPDC004111 TaxID=3364690 RepID=UPI00367675B1
MTTQIDGLRRPVGAAVLAVAAVSVGLATGSSVSNLIKCSTTSAVLAAIVMLVWLPGRAQPRILVAAPLYCVASLYVTFRYQGPADNTSALWILAESFVALALIVPAVRNQRPVASAGVALALVMTASLLPLRIALTLEPPSEPRQAAVLCLVWGLAACAVVGASCYLRTLDNRRRRTLVAERRAHELQVARELHDFAAHDVTGVMVLAQAARMLAESSPDQALALLPQIEDASVQALKSMDRTIRIFSRLEGERRADRDKGGEPVESAPGNDRSGPEGEGGRARRLSQLPALVEQFERSGVIPVRTVVPPGALEGLPEPVDSVGYRVVLEAFTNVRRHAPASPRVSVTVQRTTRNGAPLLRLVVDNEPAPPDAALGTPEVEREGGGTGIPELRKRLAELDGELTAEESPDGGWRVTALLPLRTEQVSAPVRKHGRTVRAST